MTDQDHIAHLEAELAAKDRQIAHLREQVAATAAMSALADLAPQESADLSTHALVDPWRFAAARERISNTN